MTPLKSLWVWSRFPRLVALLLSLCGRLRRSLMFKVRSALVSRTTGARSPPIRVRAGSLYSRSQLGVVGGACFGSGLGLRARRILFSPDRRSATLDALRRLLRDPMLILCCVTPCTTTQPLCGCGALVGVTRCPPSRASGLWVAQSALVTVWPRWRTPDQPMKIKDSALHTIELPSRVSHAG